MTTTPAGIIAAERDRRVAAWAEKLDYAVAVLDSMAGNPIPAELDIKLADRARAKLPALLEVLEAS